MLKELIPKNCCLNRNFVTQSLLSKAQRTYRHQYFFWSGPFNRVRLISKQLKFQIFKLKVLLSRKRLVLGPINVLQTDRNMPQYSLAGLICQFHYMRMRMRMTSFPKNLSNETNF